MPEDVTLYRTKLVGITEIPAPDSLVQGTARISEIKLSVAGSYKRGELLLSMGENEFLPATAAGLASAIEICILCKNEEVPASSTVFTAGYFMGTFDADSVILSYETEADVHAELMAEIATTLRRRNLYLV